MKTLEEIFEEIEQSSKEDNLTKIILEVEIRNKKIDQLIFECDLLIKKSK